MSSKLSSFLTTERRRWLALIVVCMAQLMIVLDTTIVNVALPVIQRDLHFTQGNLTWVVNAFLLTAGSLLLLAGRLSDLIGRRRLFLSGVIVFTIASLLCGLAPDQGLLIAARFLQGIGAAMQASVILAIIVTEFPQPHERAKAMSAYVFTAVAGGSLGLLAGGVLTEALSWHWIFFVNLPIGLITLLLGRLLLPRDEGLGLGEGVDYAGSLLVTSSLMLAVYAIVSATAHGWGSTPGARLRRAGGGPDGGVRRGRDAGQEPDHAAADPQLPRLGRRERRPRPARHRDVRRVLPRHAVHGARAPLLARSRPAPPTCRGR